MRTGPLNLITDVAGLKVGNAQDDRLKSGVTALMCDQPYVASCQVMGGAPGTRETDLLSPQSTVQAVDAIVLSGGSAFGLDAASGVQNFLRDCGRGFPVGPVKVPIVPAAILFDLINGGDKAWKGPSPYMALGSEAAKSASCNFAMGSVGAGTGALTAGLKGGLGSASYYLPDIGVTIGALAATNSLGATTIAGTRHFWAAPFEIGDEFGGLSYPHPFPRDAQDLRIKFRDQRISPEGTNTTIAVIATDAKLTKAECQRLAIAAHDGFARAIWPAHTPFDGDIVFSISTGCVDLGGSIDAFIDLCAAASSTMSRAIARGIYEATPQDGDIYPVWSSLR
ncbi:MAG: P1 family peptidase [Ahrensia sp.]|nr:P1 family peptidase [Ahrensia sp.]